MKTLLVTYLIIISCFYTNAQDQNFIDFQSGRIAFEKYNDCEEAEKLLEPIQTVFKEDLSFVHLYAKVLKCLDKYKEALTVLQTYNSVAQDPTIDEEIAELNYKFKKEIGELENEKKAKDLNGSWEVISSNGDGYATATLTIQHTDNNISIKNSYYSEYGSAKLFSEDERYIKYRGNYTSKYTYTHNYQTALQAMYGAGAYNSETLKTEEFWNDVYFTFDKIEKTFSFSVPKVKIDNDGYITKTYGDWFLTARKK